MGERMWKKIAGLGSLVIATAGICLTARAGEAGQEWIPSLREYLYPDNEIVQFYVERGNYREKMSVIDYEDFDISRFLFRLYGEYEREEELDTNGDGTEDTLILSFSNQNLIKMSDSNGDGMLDWYYISECMDGVHCDFQAVFTDKDHNGTIDQVETIIAFPDDVLRGRFSLRYTYADYKVLNWDTGEADYQNKGAIQLIQMDSAPSDSLLKVNQYFRDLDGDGYADMMGRTTYYDTNYDGVEESTKFEKDWDMDGVFEDVYVFDGTMFDHSLLYD